MLRRIDILSTPQAQRSIVCKYNQPGKLCANIQRLSNSANDNKVGHNEGITRLTMQLSAYKNLFVPLSSFERGDHKLPAVKDYNSNKFRVKARI